MSKFSQGEFIPKHPEKYVGQNRITYRSSWELYFMTAIDAHPSVLQWASESLKIPYRNPLTGKGSIYVPDFFIFYQNENGHNHGEVIEIKPKSQSVIESAKSQRDKLMVIVNHAKWAAAQRFCASHNLVFRVVTETDLFHNGSIGKK